MAIDQSDLTNWGKTYLTRLRETMQVESVWLFGSRIRSDATKDSDLDVAVVSPEFDEHFSAASRKSNLALWHLGVPCDIEIHGLGVRDFRQGGILIEEICRYGIQIT
ncbi:MAG: nucleotidyltransferase domain-containing protein [Bacilli bacterium]